MKTELEGMLPEESTGLLAILITIGRKAKGASRSVATVAVATLFSLSAFPFFP